jgi:hypothetical protein
LLASRSLLALSYFLLVLCFLFFLYLHMHAFILFKLHIYDSFIYVIQFRLLFKLRTLINTV